MKCQFHNSFFDDLEKVDKKLFGRIEQVLTQLQNCNKLSEIKNLKKLSGFKNYYRIRVGNYRIGFALIDNVIHISRILLRKDFYKKFP